MCRRPHSSLPHHKTLTQHRTLLQSSRAFRSCGTAFFHWGCLLVENKRKKAVEKDYAVMLEAVEDYYTTKIPL